MRQVGKQLYGFKVVSVYKSLGKALTSWLQHICCVPQPQLVDGPVIAVHTEVITVLREMDWLDKE